MSCFSAWSEGLLSLPTEAEIAGGPPYPPDVHMNSEDPNSSHIFWELFKATSSPATEAGGPDLEDAVEGCWLGRSC